MTDGSHIHHRAASQSLRQTMVIDSARLFADRNEVQIRHDGQMYRLRVTKNGKLILNK